MSSDQDCCSSKHGRSNGCFSGGVYGVAFIGAAFYYIQHADGFWMGVLGVIKAMVWPALVVYKMLEFLKM
jgi:hypothetical protein